MANKRIGDLTAASALNDVDLFLISQSGTSKKLTADKVKEGILANALVLYGNTLGSALNGDDLNSAKYRAIGIWKIDAIGNLVNGPSGVGPSAGTLIVRDALGDYAALTDNNVYRQHIYIDKYGKFFCVRAFYKMSGSWTYDPWVRYSSDADFADIIVERGTDENGWTYEKWASGKAECWKTDTRTVNMNSSWGSWYGCSRFTISLPSGLFNAVPKFFFTASGTSCVVTPDGIGTSARTPYIYYYRPTSASGEVNLDIHCIGTWMTPGE